MRLLLTIFIILLSTSLYANSGGYYEYNNNCREAYKCFMSLQPEKGQQYLAKEASAHPNNLMQVYLADYDDCLLLLFNGDEQDYNRLKANMDKRLKLLANGDSKSPWYRLCRSGIYMHWAFVSFRFGDNLKAASLLRKSYIVIKENERLFPSFQYNDVFFGIEEAALGAIPKDYKWIASIFGMKGDVKKGIAKLDAFIDRHSVGDMLYDESLVYAAYLKFYLLSDKKGVWQMLNSQQYHRDNNLLFLFVKSNIALNNRNADVAIQTLQEAKRIPSYKRYPLFEFELAQAQYLKLDVNCRIAFKTFLSKYTGTLFVKDAYKQLALSYYISGEVNKAKYTRSQILAHGSTVVDADKQAQRFAKEELWPNKLLLETSLLIDGGFYKAALDKIRGYSESDFKTQVEKTEYRFRLGRIYEELGKDDEAIRYYKATILIGKGRKEHFAARSALQMGFIYEAQNKRASAILMYKQALSMEGHDYKNSIDQQAKAGINRLSL